MKVVTVLLVIAMFLERYFFIVTVYKTKYFGYCLIMTVIFLNMIIQAIQAALRKDKHKRSLHEMFRLKKTPKVGPCIFGVLG